VLLVLLVLLVPLVPLAALPAVLAVSSSPQRHVAAQVQASYYVNLTWRLSQCFASQQRRDSSPSQCHEHQSLPALATPTTDR